MVSGLLFGAGMIISNMTDPQLVLAFLDIGGHWDPSLAFVMAGALLVYAPVYHFIIKPKQKPLAAQQFSLPTSTKVDSTLLSGAAIFGVGWGLVGICPGPAIASLGGGTNIMLGFVLSMLVGMIAAGQYLNGRLPLPFVGYRRSAVKS
ncbi:transporter [Paraferrimonas haliotis]|uniref:Transporter n=2 Tax=Paraferrimonas haliotis TaxID=2013866 RepID=A0AA37TMZ4_9GAMM|nr:transporter [Paraferrimonas haliotis]